MDQIQTKVSIKEILSWSPGKYFFSFKNIQIYLSLKHFKERLHSINILPLTAVDPKLKKITLSCFKYVYCILYVYYIFSSYINRKVKVCNCQMKWGNDADFKIGTDAFQDNLEHPFISAFFLVSSIIDVREYKSSVKYVFHNYR